MNWLRKFSAGLFSFLLSVAFQWFLMALSVRPLSSLARAAHLLVWIFCACGSNRQTDRAWGFCEPGVLVAVGVASSKLLNFKKYFASSHGRRDAFSRMLTALPDKECMQERH